MGRKKGLKWLTTLLRTIFGVDRSIFESAFSNKTD